LTTRSIKYKKNITIENNVVFFGSKIKIMTAVVGILNKQAVAIAADSAVTIGGANGRKIFNRANKVFTLSKRHPVGIMLYNSASFMSTPWETIIKVYRKQLGDKNFPTVKEFQENFISFLRERNFYATEEDSKKAVHDLSFSLLTAIIKEIAKDNAELLNISNDENKLKVLELFEKITDGYTTQFLAEDNCCEDFSDYSFGDFENFFDANYEELLNENFALNGYLVSEGLKKKFKSLIYLYLKRKEIFTNFTGLIFAGFGEDEIYPSLIPVNISLSIGKRLRYYFDENKAAVITNENNGFVRPFAQTDVIDTILSGIDPKLDETYLRNFETYFSKYNETILNLIGDTNPELTAQISGLDVKEILNEYNLQNLETKRTNYIYPLMDAVSNLSKEDLAEMAESLIYLTYLKRRITFAEESVGGPVDVAIISKGDGFIWIKRKHYFKPELNQYFFDNYFNTK
jgi:hypothetical protein